MKKFEEYPLVTICIPAYNHENYVQETIQSVLDQTYPNIELILINDGSIDNTSNSINVFETKCKAKLSNYVYINRCNRGLVSTLNEMIKMATGEFIKVIASDDILKETLVEESVSFLSINNVDLLFFNLDIIDNSSNVIQENIPGIKGLGTELNDISELSLEKSLDYNRFYGPAYFLRKNVYDKVGYYNEKILIEDWEFLLRCIKSNIKYDHLAKALVKYRDHANNSWKRPIFVLTNNLKILNEYKRIGNHKERVKKLFTRSINSIFMDKNFDHDNIKTLQEFLKQEKISAFSFLPNKYKVFIKFNIIIYKNKYESLKNIFKRNE